MKLLHGLKLRENVQLAGIPIIWKTNHSDEDVHDFYQHLMTDPDFASFTRRNDGVDSTKSVSISFEVFSKAIDFKDGCCQCFGIFNTLWLIYRTTEEWQLLEAREMEIQELRDEQRQELEVEEIVFQNEDNYLSAKLAECLTNKNYPEAVRFLSLRMELRKQNPKIKRYLVSQGGLMREAVKTLCNFPQTDDGIRFILEHFPWSWVLFDFAKNYWASSFLNRQSKLVEMDKIFGAVNEHFQTDARIHKMICLFLEKEGELERAIQHCKICTSRHLNDGTVNGFSGRLKRFEKKVERGIKRKNTQIPN